MKLTEDELFIIDNVKVRLIRFFKDMDGFFYPFGFAILSDRQAASINAWTGEDFPEPESLIDILEKLFLMT